MLILSRRLGEAIKIGSNISINILGITGSQVRIGISAPKEVSVHREEVYERIEGQQQSLDAPEKEKTEAPLISRKVS